MNWTGARWPPASDPERARLGLERWQERTASANDPVLAGFAADLAGDPQGRALLDAVFGNSPFLTECLLGEAAFLRRLLAEDPGRTYRSLYDDAGPLAYEDDTARLMTALRQGKRRLAILTALADIAGVWSLDQVTAALSGFADLSVSLVGRHLLRRAAYAGDLDLAAGSDGAGDVGRGSGLVVLAMGKLGASELNYSSDIDLIVLYDDQRVRTSRPDRMARTFIRLTRDLVRIMEERTADGYIFRTDLRLRPDPGATPVAVSVSAAEAYYGAMAESWERAAMIKARPMAGDLAAGEDFVRLMRPFVWRRSLDFAAIQDIHAIKRQIHRHRGHAAIAVNGHNIKLGRGGIREIEFFAQTQQLIFGGRDPRLRVAGTCAALQALAAAGRIDARTTQDLVAAYHFLRRLEHRLQMIDDQQIHELPAADAGIDAVGRFLGFEDPEPFRHRLRQTLERVEEIYAELFEDEPALAGPSGLVFTGADDDLESQAALGRMGFENTRSVLETVRGWLRGRYRSTRSDRARHLLKQLLPTLLQALARTPNPDTALFRLDGFLGRLPTGVQLFSLFYANPGLLELVAEILGTSDRLADHLAHHPALLDGVLTPGFFGRFPDAAPLRNELDQLLATASDYEDTLVALRRWTSDKHFCAGVQILRHLAKAGEWAPFLTDVAEVGLRALLTRVEAEFAERHGRFAGGGAAVIAMGKLGSRETSIRSDLDLIVVHDTPDDLSESDGPKPLPPNLYFTRLTQRLISAITLQTREGPLYEVDMRLRPSGRAGPLATSLEAFKKYQKDSAWTWEHMALTRARVIAGPEGLRAAITDVVARTLTRPRDVVGLLTDVADMRERIDKEHHTDNPWSVKHARGGLVDIEFIAQYLQLRHAHAHPSVLSPGTETALTRLADADLLDRGAARELIEALRLWQQIQAYLRLTCDDPFEPAHAPPALRSGLARVVLPEEEPPSADIARAEAHVRRVAAAVLAHYRRIIDEPARANGEAR